MHSRGKLLLLAAILSLAAALRLHDLGSELWYDEILTAIRVSNGTPLEILTMYDSQNQHVLYSLLARFSYDVFGDGPAALRLPAALFGVLGVGAVYLLGRDLLSEREGLLAAAFLAVSDLHVWFSQDARAYSALLFFAVFASWLLLRAQGGTRLGLWLAYGVVAALGVHAHLAMLFVLAGHAVIAAEQRAFAGPLLGFGVAAVLTVLLYLPILPELLAVTAVEGRDGVVREWHSTSWALAEVAPRLRDSFGGWLQAIAAIVVGLVGLASLVRRKRIVLELLVYPLAIGAGILVLSGHHLWPRLFLFALGFAVLVAIAGATALGEGIARRLRPGRSATGAGVVVALLLIAGAALSLPRAYGPKQRYVEALDLLRRERRPGDVVLVTNSRRVFLDYYGLEGRAIGSVADVEEARREADRVWLLHTFPVAHRSARSEIEEVVEREFEAVGRFPGTVRGGDVLVWRWERAPQARPFNASPRSRRDG
ncbi:MAG: hypothetical protein FJ144_06730 [Deltaproteobacteria bacterium]|nr:hypothetical protein [Deltaproteobacteria bacterium]